jgi:hypothetical protein
LAIAFYLEHLLPQSNFRDMSVITVPGQTWIHRNPSLDVLGADVARIPDVDAVLPFVDAPQVWHIRMGQSMNHEAALAALETRYLSVDQFALEVMWAGTPISVCGHGVSAITQDVFWH